MGFRRALVILCCPAPAIAQSGANGDIKAWQPGLDAPHRRQAVLALEQGPPRLVVAALIEALGDVDLDVRVGSARALGRFRAKAALPRLRDHLLAEEAKMRAEATSAIGRIAIAEPAATPSLLRASQDPDSAVRLAALSALGELPDRIGESLQAALGRVDDASPAVRRQAVDVVGALAPDLDPDRDVAIHRRVVVTLITRLGDSSQDVRARALVALARLGDSGAAPAVSRLLSDVAEDVRREAIKALAQLAPVGATRTLRAMLRRPTETLGPSLVLALGELGARGDSVAADEVVQALDRADLQLAAREALRHMAHSPTRPAELLDALSERLARRADPVLIDVLAQLHTARATSILLAELGRQRFPVAQIIDRLAETGDLQVVPALLAIVESGAHLEQLQAATALGRLSDPRATERLLTLSHTAHADVQVKLIEALDALRTDAALPRLAEVAVDKHGPPEARLRAIRALGHLGSARAASPLLGIAVERGAPLAAEAWAALGQLGGDDALLARLAAARQLAEPADYSGATWALGHQLARALPSSGIGFTHALAVLAADADSDDVARAAPAIEALGIAGCAGSTARLLVRRLAHGPTEIRRLAAAALARATDSDTLQALGLALDDASPDVRAEAAWALGQRGDARARHTPKLEQLLDDSDDAVRINAAAALAARGQASGSDLLLDPNPFVRANATLAATKDQTSLLHFLARHDEAPVVRAAALRALMTKGQRAWAVRSAERDVVSAVGRALVPARPADRWLELQLVGEGDAPLPGSAFRLVLPTSLCRAGRSDSFGRVVEHLDDAGDVHLELADVASPGRL